MNFWCVFCHRYTQRTRLNMDMYHTCELGGLSLFFIAPALGGLGFFCLWHGGQSPFNIFSPSPFFVYSFGVFFGTLYLQCQRVLSWCCALLILKETFFDEFAWCIVSENLTRKDLMFTQRPLSPVRIVDHHV